MGDNKYDVNKMRSIFNPILAQLHKACEQFPELCFSGFLFDFDESFLMYYGNVVFEKPEELVYLHHFLAAMQVNLEGMGLFHRDILNPGAVTNAVSPASKSVESADKLAQEVAMLPDDIIPQRLRDLAAQYFSSRTGK